MQIYKIFYPETYQKQKNATASGYLIVLGSNQSKNSLTL